MQQEVVKTSIGELTLSPLTLGDLRQLPSIFQQPEANPSFSESLDRMIPALIVSLRKVHQDITKEQLEAGLTMPDFNALQLALLKVSGLTKGEATPVVV